LSSFGVVAGAPAKSESIATAPPLLRIEGPVYMLSTKSTGNQSIYA
jgi:hypothetical protein